MADTQKVDHPVFYRVVGTVPYSDYSGKAPRQVYRSLDIQCVGRWSPVGSIRAIRLVNAHNPGDHWAAIRDLP